MNIYHRIAVNSEDVDTDEFLEAGLKVNAGWDSYEIPIEDPRFNRIEELIKKFDLHHELTTKFSDSDQDNAHYLSLGSDWENGWAMPDDGLAPPDLSFDKSDCCNFCGCGSVQKAPLRLKKAPKWKKRSLFTLVGIYDEILIRKSVWKKVFEPLGVDCWDVLKYKSDEILDDVVQLKIPVSRSSFKSKQQVNEICPKCGVVKYSEKFVGFYPPIDSRPDLPIFKTKQNFGSGGNCYKVIIVTANTFKQLKESRVIGGRFLPLEDSSE